jgi:hypothetical protein
MKTVKYRLVNPGLAPRRTKMEVPGWSGAREPRRDGSREQVWHCLPFTESAQYGIEIFYPYETELGVSTFDGKLVFAGDLGPDPGTGVEWPPFRTFGERFYTYQLLLDLKPEPGYAVRVEPHPRFYTDVTDTCPIAVPALVRGFWPMLSFMVFKAPSEGRTHVFRPGEPMAQLIVIPAEPDIGLEPMGEAEAAERELQARRIHASRQTLASETTWLSTSNTVFDGTYRHLLRAAKARESGD